MKLAGSMLGLILGALAGEWWGAVVGGIVGLVAGSLIDTKFQRSRDEWIKELQKIELEFNAQRARILALENRIELGDTVPMAVLTPSVVPEPVREVEIRPAVVEPPEPKRAEPQAIPKTASATAEEVHRSTARSAEAATRSAKRDEPSMLWKWLFGGNAMVRVGIIVLFFGVAFLIKYASEHVTVPIELRLAGIALGAIVLLGLGWRLRHRKGAYGLLLQGGGIGILYLVIFGAFRMWGVLPAGLSFALLLAVVVLSAILAVLQNAPALAVAGAAGGFLAPILTSTGGGSHVMLFSYYLVLNLGVLGIAWFKAWRILNFVGFIFTFGIGAAWGAKYFTPAHFASSEPFLIAFFLMYVGIAVLFALRRMTELKDYVDSTMVFGTPVAAFALQWAMVAHFEYGAAWSALAAGLFYLLLAQFLLKLGRPTLQRLIECFIALGVGFATLAIPLALDDRSTSAVWALEGLGAIWMGIRQRRRLGLFFGVLLQFAAGYFFLIAPSVDPIIAVLNSSCLGALLIGVSGVYAGRLLLQVRDDMRGIDQVASTLLLCWGVMWTLAAGATEIMFWLTDSGAFNALIAYCAGVMALLGILANRWQWNAARFITFLLLPALCFFAAVILTFGDHPSDDYGWIAWPFAIAVVYRLLRWNETMLPRIAAIYHCFALWLTVVLAAWEFGTRIEDWVGDGRVWGMVAWPVVPALTVWWLATRKATARWPFSAHLKTYLLEAAGALMLFVYLWIWVANFKTDGNPAPLPYVPILNPFDLAVIFAGLVGILWWRALQTQLEAPLGADLRSLAKLALGAAVFVWANGVLLRSLHHYAEVPFALDEMLRSTLVQTSFSIFWSLLALGAMLWAHRHTQRALWVTGACLLAVVVVKLFFIDLSQIAGLQRIVSFLGVGILMLVIGYFVPVPPRRQEVTE